MEDVLNFDEKISYLKEKSLYFEKLSNDKKFLYQEINNLSKEQINRLINLYQEKIGPQNILRLTVLKSLQNGIQITEEFYKEIQDKFLIKDLDFFHKYFDDEVITFINNYSAPKGGNSFVLWKDSFRGLYTLLYYGDCKKKVLNCFNQMADYLISELNLNDYKIDITGFDGAQNQGQTRAWVNIFPAVLKNYNNSIGYFFEVNQGKFLSGLSKSYTKKIDIEIPQEFLSKEYFNFYDALNNLKQAKNFASSANNELISKLNNEQDNINDETLELNITDVVKNLYWYQAIGLSMYMNGKNNTYKVQSLEKQPIIAKYATLKESHSVYLTLQGQLQIHTSKDSQTVNYTKKTPPAIFDKDENAEWYLTENGIKYIEAELSEYIEKLNNPQLYKEKRTETHYWTLSAGEKARLWEDFQENSIIAVGFDENDLGNLEQYKSKAEIQLKLSEYNPQSTNKNNALCLWQFANDMQIGDIVFIKNTQTTILGRGIVKSEYIYDEDRKEYKHTRKVEWTHIGEWKSATKWAIKTLTDITQYIEDVEKLENMFNVEVEEKVRKYEEYGEEKFLQEIFMDKKQYTTLKNLLLNKKNIILQGAPGVGKTYTAKRLCYSILGKMDTSKVEMIQFHQNYGYEDFIMGYRPNEKGFELVEGPFYKFCENAKNDVDNDYFFIIDEINRGKLSKIFGELLMLIEPDKRGEHLRLLYKDVQFCVPENVYIIGMMNTADRSIAMIDYALRRRFAFYEFQPAFETESFCEKVKKADNPKFSVLIKEIIRLNQVITEDNSLGSGFQIGHSYFCPPDDVIIDDDWLNSVVDYEIIPLLKEYWFDEENKVKEWTFKLKNAIR